MVAAKARRILGYSESARGGRPRRRRRRRPPEGRSHLGGKLGGVVAGDMFGEVVDSVLTDNDALRQRWRQALAGPVVEIPPLVDTPSWMPAAIGMVFHDYVDRASAGEPWSDWRPLINTDSVDDKVLAWLGTHEVEVPPEPKVVGRNPPTPGPHGLSFVGEYIFDGPRLPIPNPPRLLAHLEALVKMAESLLFPSFADIAPELRHTWFPSLIGTVCVVGAYSLNYPDSILGDTMLEIKTGLYRSPQLGLRRQTALQVLLDLYDRYKVRHVAWYLARQGILVKAPLSELLIVDQVPGGLPALRERCRKARSAFERRWHGGTNVRCVLWLWDLARRQHGGPLCEPRCSRCRQGRRTESHLRAVCRVDEPGQGQNRAKDNCPVSRALTGTAITVDAVLE
jgi:hypothetical protein